MEDTAICKKKKVRGTEQKTASKASERFLWFTQTATGINTLDWNRLSTVGWCEWCLINGYSDTIYYQLLPDAALHPNLVKLLALSWNTCENSVCDTAVCAFGWEMTSAWVRPPGNNKERGI